MMAGTQVVAHFQRLCGCPRLAEVETSGRKALSFILQLNLRGADLPQSARPVLVILGRLPQADLPQMVATLLVVSALSQFVSLVGAGHIRIKVGRVISQETAAEQLLLLPNSEQQNLCLFELLLLHPVEAIPELLRCKTLSSKAPYRAEDRAVIPAGYFGLGAWLANPMDGGQ
jgi:hypothetical protein